MEEKLRNGDHVLVNKRSIIERYDVVGFSLTGEADLYVKRVIGLPGDRVIVSQRMMLISLNEENDFTTTYRVSISKEVAEKWQHLKRIPKDHYFLLGDHLDVSKDSRTFGFVSKNLIEGKVQLRLYPVRRVDTIS